ncbi:helix-turn-helix transcriptional regulator [Streptomyces sp. LP05-1]|uniref:Helix-turn-helix transcriptional regulator n=1 Tax=Streptomyces pyxinae TaxID=2970734 RepID=A0ABT2CPW4_9ACTN|nr:helix-turn-helix transcriptional regulator [Streptomyces sp. LP05-1]MCS0639360.1 helix-turn-helix transcriptional regulator [Streptomyces sp. LP05-1]
MNYKKLNPDSSPQARFGADLRSKREEKGWRQWELADEMGYSASHVSSVENGRKLSTLRFACHADSALGTGDMFERKWREIRLGSLLEGFPEYLGYEGRAVEIRLYEIGIVPGLLQIGPYAQTLADIAVQRGAITVEQAKERVTLLAERQAALVRAKPPIMIVVMDESCIRRPVGGPKVMSAQLQALLDFAARPHTALHIAPFSMGEHRAFDLPVNLLTMADRSLVAYAESQTQGHMDRETSLVVPLLNDYHHLQTHVLSQVDSVAMIKQALSSSRQ